MNYQEQLLKAIPGGAHTYSRGYDQYPSNAPQILKRGKGAYIYDENEKSGKINRFISAEPSCTVREKMDRLWYGFKGGMYRLC